MAFLTPENRACIDDLDNFELSQADGSLLTSFLDDTQVLEDCDDERLASVMRSLEAEIDLHVADDQNSFKESTWNSSNSSYDESTEGRERPSSNMFDFNWMNMEMEMEMMEMEMVGSSPSDGMASWYMDAACKHEMDGATGEFGNDQRDYPQPSYYGISFEDHEYSSYVILWQETNYTPMVTG